MLLKSQLFNFSSLTLRTRIDVHVRLFILSKKLTLYALIWDVYDYSLGKTMVNLIAILKIPQKMTSTKEFRRKVVS